MERDPILVEREKTHGSFDDYSTLAMEIIDKISKHRYDKGIPTGKPQHREAVSMIVRKLSRIVNGKENHKDHWDDIAGYAKLGAEACDG